jgi:hypothetical protein
MAILYQHVLDAPKRGRFLQRGLPFLVRFYLVMSLTQSLRRVARVYDWPWVFQLLAPQLNITMRLYRPQCPKKELRGRPIQVCHVPTVWF